MYTRNPLVFAFACAAALCACNDNHTPAPTAAAALPAAPPQQTELAGTVVLSGMDMAPIYLRTSDGLTPLEGSVALPMASVIGAVVNVNGTWDTNSALIVTSFVVVGVQGLPAFDGVVEAMPGGYALRLADGTDHMLDDAPAALLACVGARVWLTVAPDASIAFGVIQ